MHALVAPIPSGDGYGHWERFLEITSHMPDMPTRHDISRDLFPEKCLGISVVHVRKLQRDSRTALMHPVWQDKVQRIRSLVVGRALPTIRWRLALYPGDQALRPMRLIYHAALVLHPKIQPGQRLKA